MGYGTSDTGDGDGEDEVEAGDFGGTVKRFILGDGSESGEPTDSVGSRDDSSSLLASPSRSRRSFAIDEGLTDFERGKFNPRFGRSSSLANSGSLS